MINKIKRKIKKLKIIIKYKLGQPLTADEASLYLGFLVFRIIHDKFYYYVDKQNVKYVIKDRKIISKENLYN